MAYIILCCEDLGNMEKSACLIQLHKTPKPSQPNLYVLQAESEMVTVDKNMRITLIFDRLSLERIPAVLRRNVDENNTQAENIIMSREDTAYRQPWN